MGRCKDYWAIAEAHADLFNVHRHRFTKAGTTHDEHLNLLKERRNAALQELDQHVADCPICQKYD
jgi:hypothetical protein